jgi:hypothetical protein
MMNGDFRAGWKDIQGFEGKHFSNATNAPTSSTSVAEFRFNCAGSPTNVMHVVHKHFDRRGDTHMPCRPCSSNSDDLPRFTKPMERLVHIRFAQSGKLLDVTIDSRLVENR